MVDLFAGTGAFTFAFEQTGHVQVVFANDVSSASEKIYTHNFPSHSFRLGDVNEISVEMIPSHDILTAGFPCQPFSIAGHREGFNDVRSNVFWKIVEIMKYHQPKCVILENVKNILSHNNKQTFQIIKSEIENIGYSLNYRVLNTATITGIPHHRERVFIICFKNTDSHTNQLFNLEFPEIKKKPISEFLERNIPTKYYYTKSSAIWNTLHSHVVRPNTIYQYRRVYVRENKNGECPTLTANMGSGGHNVPILLDDVGIRKLTPRECFSLQGFPSSYTLPETLSNSCLYHLVGNAVSVSVVVLIADRIVSFLFAEETKIFS
jgi:DNA (cytosine-5)-methyltransferase 1